MTTALVLIFYIFGVIATLGYFVSESGKMRLQKATVFIGSLLYPLFWAIMLIGVIVLSISKYKKHKQD